VRVATRGERVQLPLTGTGGRCRPAGAATSTAGRSQSRYAALVTGRAAKRDECAVITIPEGPIDRGTYVVRPGQILPYARASCKV